jgi:hypothetical protein
MDNKVTRQGFIDEEIMKKSTKTVGRCRRKKIYRKLGSSCNRERCRR